MTKTNQICPQLEAAFELLGKRWTGLIIGTLLAGPKRLKDIFQAIPDISNRILLCRLKELQEAGIVNRIVHPEMPVRIEYGLTKKGIDLQPTLIEAEKWADT